MYENEYLYFKSLKEFRSDSKDKTGRLDPKELNKAVDLCYRPQAFTNEAARIEYLFDLYNQYTMPLLNDSKKTKKEKVHTSLTIEN